MRIGIEFTSAVTQGAGIGRLTRGLVRALERLDRANDYRLVVTKDRRNRQVGPLASNFNLAELPITERQANVLWHRLRVPWDLQRFTGPLDLFHGTNFVLPPVGRTPALVTIHDLSYRLFPEAAEPSLVKFLERAVPDGLRRARLVVADSESTRQDVAEQYGVPLDRIRVVYGGVDDRFQRVTDRDRLERVKMQYGIDGPAILAVGTLQPRKNITRLVQAYQLLRELNLPHRLYIAGASGWMYSDLFVQIEELGLTPFIKFLGFVRDEDLPALYSVADLYVYPSLYEGFGLPVLEALACGAVVVCSGVSSIPEVGGDAVMYCDPYDVPNIAMAMDRALNDEGLRDRLRARAPEQVARFSWPNAGRSLLQAYAEALG